MVVNGAEGEPATFKDRELMRMNPFKILEGALIVALVVDAREIVVALKSTFGPEIARMRALSRRSSVLVGPMGWSFGSSKAQASTSSVKRLPCSR